MWVMCFILINQKRERESRRVVILTWKNSKSITSKRVPNDPGVVRFSNKKWRYFNRMMRESLWDECISFQESKGVLSRELFWYFSFVKSLEEDCYMMIRTSVDTDCWRFNSSKTSFSNFSFVSSLQETCVFIPRKYREKEKTKRTFLPSFITLG